MHTKLLLGLLAGVGLAMAPAQAAEITWTAQGTITSEEVIQPNVSAAFNLWSSDTSLAVTTSTQTVNFASTVSGPITSNGVTLTLPVANPGFMNAGILAIADVWSGSQVDEDFATVMASFAHTQSAKPSNGEFALSGLTVGQPYSVQLFSSDMRAGIGNVRTIRFDDGIGNSTSTVLQNTAPYFIGTFTADASSQSFRVFSDTNDGSTSGSVLNAITLAGNPPVPPLPSEPLFWRTPSTGSAGSMPIGNGDIGLNVWAQADGTIRAYIAKTDAWDGAGRLLRLGGVEFAFSPNPFLDNTFSQSLDVDKGQIVFTGSGGFEARLWVDANAPVIRFQASSTSGVSVSAKPNIWRRTLRQIPTSELTGSSWYMGGADAMGGLYGGPSPVYSYPDVVATLTGDRIGWYQRNASSFWQFGFQHQQMGGPPAGQSDPLLNRTFGCVIASPQLIKSGPELLQSPSPVNDVRVEIVALTEIVPAASDWIQQATTLSTTAAAADLALAKASHENWWQSFWERSYIHITKASEPAVPALTPTTNPLMIGTDLNIQNGFVGALAQARLYDRALTPAEIAALDAPGATPAGLVAAWDFSSFSGGGIADSAAGLVAQPFGTPQAVTVGARSGVQLNGTSGFSVANHPNLDLTYGGTLEILVSPGTQAASGGRLLDKGQPGTALGYVFDTYPANSLRLITSAGTLSGGSSVLPVGGWHRVVAVITATGRQIYLNGNRIAGEPPVSQTPLAERLNLAYRLQRYISACAGRGAFPIKFNGSMFWGERQDVDGSAAIDPDWRMWAGDYWWQNTRLPYYPMLASGDFEMMKPLFEMYYNRLPTEIARTASWFGCQGAFVGETASFWGMMSNGDYGYNRSPTLLKGEPKNSYVRYYWQPGIELTFMMLDYYDHTGDEDFVRDRLAPMAEAYLSFYSSRFGRDANGKLIIAPAQSLETWQNVVNPTPDVAGLAQVTKRILALPTALVPASLRTLALQVQAATPAIPTRVENGNTLIGFAAQVNSGRTNYENPELYTVYPYRNYGIGKPGLELARETYAARLTKDYQGWHQSGMQAACLGMADEAAAVVISNVENSNPNFRFPVMWGPNYDWVPDQDHGSNLINTLQLMLLQADGNQIFLAPAWPDGWEADFKLHAPGGSAVEASIRNGEIVNLTTVPPRGSLDYETWAQTEFGADYAAQGGRNQDPDGDGQRNESEYLAKTDPADGQSRLEISSMDLVGATFTLRWLGTRGVIYRVMASPDLTNWTPLDDLLFIGQDAEMESTGPAAADRRFYRVEVVR